MFRQSHRDGLPYCGFVHVWYKQVVPSADKHDRNVCHRNICFFGCLTRPPFGINITLRKLQTSPKPFLQHDALSIYEAIVQVSVAMKYWNEYRIFLCVYWFQITINFDIDARHDHNTTQRIEVPKAVQDMMHSTDVRGLWL